MPGLSVRKLKSLLSVHKHALPHEERGKACLLLPALGRYAYVVIGARMGVGRGRVGEKLNIKEERAGQVSARKASHGDFALPRMSSSNPRYPSKDTMCMCVGASAL
ncbi:hypothetical protein HGRIS_003047 [Hohenbuehelia grisea]|uniref:Uncharacterized protein n=1 Tax=Hohenbuehelia grisea TaxID=104357 RepID=A0ABR3JMA6_9AGAR